MPHRALVVENDTRFRPSLIATMRHLDFVVVATAETAGEALSAARNHDWRVMVLNLTLREGLAFMVLTGLLLRAPSQRILVLSDNVTPGVRRICAAMGANGVFDKATELHTFFGELDSVGTTC